MKNFAKNLLFFCGLFLTLAAFPLFAQENLPSEIRLNKKPLEEFASHVGEKLQKKKVDLTASFLVELDGTLTREGKFDPKQTKYIRSEGDAEMINVAMSAVEAINDTKILAHFKNLGAEKMFLKLAQDERNLMVVAVSKLPTSNRAKSMASSMNTVVSLSKMQIGNADTKVLLDALSVSDEGENFVLNFSIPKDIYLEMLLRKVKALGEERR